MGRHLLGVRTDTYDLDTLLRAALEPHVADGAPSNNNYSVRLDDTAAGPTTPLRTLYRGQSLEVASRSPGRVIDALLTQLSTWALERRDDLLRVDAVAAVGDGRAALLPASLACHSPILERRLAHAGISLADAPVAHLDARTGKLVVSPPQLAIDWEPLAPLRDRGPRPASEGTPVMPGHYPVACWAFADAQGDGGPPSRAAAILRAGGLTRRPRGMTGQQLFDVLTAALATARTVTVAGSHAEAADAIIAALDG